MSESTTKRIRFEDCRHELEFRGWTTSHGQMRRCRLCGGQFTDWVGTRYWDASIPTPALDEPVTRCNSGAPLSAHRRKELAASDAMPTHLRACVHEFGWPIVNACLQAGVREPSKIRHLVREIWDGARQPVQRKAGAINSIDWILTQLSAGLDHVRLARFLWLKGYAIVPREPSHSMIDASMQALNDEGLVSRSMKHRIRLRAAIRQAVGQQWPTLIAADDTKNKSVRDAA